MGGCVFRSVRAVRKCIVVFAEWPRHALYTALLATVMFGCGFQVPAEEPPSTPVPTPPQSTPDTNTQPATDANSQNPPAISSPRLATFLDFVPDKELLAPVGGQAFPTVDNYASPVANALANHVTNEGIFLRGAGPDTVRTRHARR